jgi:hypothetical protein
MNNESSMSSISKMWNANELFDAALKSFRQIVASIVTNRLNPDDDMIVGLAKEGFLFGHSIEKWTELETHEVLDKFHNDFLPGTINFYQSEAIALACFSAVCFGAIMSLVRSKTIDSAGQLYGELLLAGYTRSNDNQIIECYFE